MNNIIQCKICNKPFQTTGGKVCGTCLIEIDVAFVVLRDYLYDNPGNIAITKLSEKTEIPENIILHLIREGRLELDGHGRSGGVLLCSVCHKPIKEGSMCTDCRNNLALTLNSTLPPPEPSKPGQAPGGRGRSSGGGGEARMHSGGNKR